MILNITLLQSCSYTDPRPVYITILVLTEHRSGNLGIKSDFLDPFHFHYAL